MSTFVRYVLGRRLGALATVVVGVLLLVLPSTTSARKLQMSGTWAIREGNVFLPLQPVETLGGPQRTATSMGDLSKGLGFPNDAPILGGGPVTATGSAPPTLRIPRHRFESTPEGLINFWRCCSDIQLTTMLVVDAPYDTATLRAGGGPGTLQWCPNDTLSCPVTGPPNGGARNGRVIYLAGANRFGGTMQIGLAGGGIYYIFWNAIPFQIGHAYLIRSGPTLRPPAVGRGTPSNPWTRMNYLAPIVVTQPTMVTSIDGYLHVDPGPKLTTMVGLTTTGTGPIFRFPVLGTSAQGMSVGQSTTEFGFAHTTGTVIVQQTAGTRGDDFFTIMGSDMRTALGAGNISTVAGGISFVNRLPGQTPYATFHKVWFSLAPPVPSLSPAGAAVAGALILLAVGYTLCRRVGR